MRAASRISAARPGRRRGPARTFKACIRSVNLSVNSARTALSTWIRLAAVHASPPLRIFAAIAPSTAASRSASSNTTNGALPPSSIDVRSTRVSAPARAAFADTGRSGERHLAQPAIGEERVGESRRVGRGQDRQHAARQAGVREDLPEQQHRQRRLRGRLDDDRAAGRERGPIFRVAIASGKFHGVIARRWTHRLFCHQDAPVAGGRRGVAPVDTHRFLGEPAQELAAVGHLAVALGERLAHFQGHQQREVVAAAMHEFPGRRRISPRFRAGVAAHAR